MSSSAEVIRLVASVGPTMQVRLGDCATLVTLSATTDDLGVTTVSQSHWIQPPDSGRSNLARRFVGAPVRRALGAAIGELATRFQHGVESGHVPSESWFVKVVSREKGSSTRKLHIAPTDPIV